MSGDEPERCCPRCEGGVVMVKHEDATLVLDHCFGCKGVWLDLDEWTPIVGRSLSVQRPESIPYAFEAPDCPACKAAGVESPGLVPRGLQDIQGVEIDVCGACGGVWLDGGELKTLQEATRTLRREERAAQQKAARETADAPRRSAGVALTSREESLSFLEALAENWKQLWS